MKATKRPVPAAGAKTTRVTIEKTARNNGSKSERNEENQKSATEGSLNTVVGDSNDWEVPKNYIIPPDQEKLTEAELSEVKTKILKANNPNAPQNIARYNNKEKTYKFEPTVEQTAFHFVDDGKLIHIESQEAKKQEEEAERKAQEIAAALAVEKGDGNEEVSIKSLKNQFNYSERASQTLRNPERDRAVMTEPPPGVEFGATATQHEIYDAYIEDRNNKLRALQAQAKQKSFNKDSEKGEDPGAATGAAPTVTTLASDLVLPAQNEVAEEDILHSQSMHKALKIMERMVNQNTYDDIAQDYKYWDDESDLYNEDGGSLLPLWKFQFPKTKKRTVTSICWNPQYPDLFAVGYGSYDFLKQGPGLICAFTLKNPSNNNTHPEYIFTTASGVMCLDFHPKYSSLLAVGLYDGTVLVYDVRQKVNRPIFQSTVKTGKHTDPVWQIYWERDDTPDTLSSSSTGSSAAVMGADTKNLNFFSISTDGRVTNWTLSKNELQYSNVIELKLVGLDDSDPELASLAGLAGGTCFDFNKTNPNLFLVGTEEGKIHECSKAYNSQYLTTYEGHHMAVYTVKWNHYHPGVFLSASADWTVKLWIQGRPHPLMSFDLGSSVGDVAWAPYSSTVFAAVSSEGKVLVYDLNINKHEPMCEQLVVKKAKLTHICFNPYDPIILVGDDRGMVISLKLSPNLRKIVELKPDENNKIPTRTEAEINKLNKIIAVAEKQDNENL